MATGGTAAPSIRMNAAARALGAPRVSAQPTTRGTPKLPRAGGNQQRGISQHQANPQHAVAQHAVKAPRAAPAKGPNLTAFNPLEGDLNGNQLGKLAGNITRQNDEATLKPLREEGKQITGAEGVALNRYAGMGQTGQQVQQGLQAGEEASAKTGENNAAEAALSASKAIETSGQSAQTMNAGYVDPAVQQALNSAQNTTAGLGGAAEQYQQAMGVSGQGLMANLRAAAAQRVTEGAGKIAQGYASSQGSVADEENKTLAKQPGEAKSLAVELGQKQLTDAATLKSLGVKEGTLGVDAQKAATEKAFKEGETKNTAQKNQITLSLGREKSADSLKKEEIKVRGELEKQGLANAGSLAKEQIKTKTALEIANKKAGRLTTSEEDKAVGELSSAYATIQQLRTKNVPAAAIREALTKGSRSVGEEVEGKTKVVKEKVPTVKSQVLVTAALEAWDYHKVSAITQQQLKKMGIESVPKVQNGELVF